MALTSPDNIFSPDAGDLFDYTVDMAALASSVQTALSGPPSNIATALAGKVGTVSVVTFTSGGTWTKPSNLLFAWVRVWGAGGGGGGAPTSTTNQASAGSPGGAGGYCEGIFNAGTLGATETVTVGTGGAGGNNTTGTTGGSSTFGASMTAGGGGGGAVLAAATTHGSIYGFTTGGSAGGGTLTNVAGARPITAMRVSNGTSAVTQGLPGAFHSYGGGGGSGGNNADGSNGGAPGGGGGGTANVGVQATARTGGTGANGRVVVVQFLAT